jgi:hypothetical protein
LAVVAPRAAAASIRLAITARIETWRRIGNQER